MEIGMLNMQGGVPFLLMDLATLANHSVDVQVWIQDVLFKSKYADSKAFTKPLAFKPGLY